MEQIKAIVELLAMVGFNFWQIFIIVVILLFRTKIVDLLTQIAELLKRLDFVKSPVGEASFASQVIKVSKEIQNIENKLSSLPDGDKAKKLISEELQSLNNDILFNAIERIKLNTTYLWPRLKFAVKNKQKIINESIREKTLKLIRNDLELFENYELIKYKCSNNGIWKTDPVLNIEIEVLNDKFLELIENFEPIRFYV
jgi:hypothetical protein